MPMQNFGMYAVAGFLGGACAGFYSRYLDINRDENRNCAEELESEQRVMHQCSAQPYSEIMASKARDGLGISMNVFEPKEPDMWDRWESVKSFLFGWRKRFGLGAEGQQLSQSQDAALPVDKLACHKLPVGKV